ncbi:MAG: hypothetical protein K6B72_08885 [Lachnospiraceae bacterium]|nr:hypothetical protein [Lachnospiraceae bacterium]
MLKILLAVFAIILQLQALISAGFYSLFLLTDEIDGYPSRVLRRKSAFLVFLMGIFALLAAVITGLTGGGDVTGAAFPLMRGLGLWFAISWLVIAGLQIIVLFAHIYGMGLSEDTLALLWHIVSMLALAGLCLLLWWASGRAITRAEELITDGDKQVETGSVVSRICDSIEETLKNAPAAPEETEEPEEIMEPEDAAETTPEETAETEAEAEPEAEPETGSKEPLYAIDYIYNTFICADENLPGEAAPVLRFARDGTFYMLLNFGEGMQAFEGTFTTSEKAFEMDSVYLYLTVDDPMGQIPAQATVVFDDSPDYCEFLDEGFGLMGYSGAPYLFLSEYFYLQQY